MAAALRVIRCVEPNEAELYLSRGRQALDRGDTIAAGCLLREAIRAQTYAECAWWGCLPCEASDRTPPFVLLKALRNAGRCPHGVFDVVAEMISVSNAAAHCCPVDAAELGTALAIFPLLVESTAAAAEGGAA